MTNKYLEKIAELSAEQKKALSEGSQLQWGKADAHGALGLLGGAAGGAALGGAVGGGGGAAAGALLGGTVGTIGGMIHGYRSAGKHNRLIDTALQSSDAKDRREAEDSIIKAGPRNNVWGFGGIAGNLEAKSQNQRYADLVARRALHQD